MEELLNAPYLLANMMDICEEDPPSPKLININKSIMNEMTSFFKLDNLFTCIRRDENKETIKNTSISKIITRIY